MLKSFPREFSSFNQFAHFIGKLHAACDKTVRSQTSSSPFTQSSLLSQVHNFVFDFLRKYNYISKWRWITKIYISQECISVGCVPPASVAVSPARTPPCMPPATHTPPPHAQPPLPCMPPFHHTQPPSLPCMPPPPVNRMTDRHL